MIGQNQRLLAVDGVTCLLALLVSTAVLRQLGMMRDGGGVVAT